MIVNVRHSEIVGVSTRIDLGLVNWTGFGFNPWEVWGWIVLQWIWWWVVFVRKVGWGKDLQSLPPRATARVSIISIGTHVLKLNNNWSFQLQRFQREANRIRKDRATYDLLKLTRFSLSSQSLFLSPSISSTSSSSYQQFGISFDQNFALWWTASTRVVGPLPSVGQKDNTTGSCFRDFLRHPIEEFNDWIQILPNSEQLKREILRRTFSKTSSLLFSQIPLFYLNPRPSLSSSLQPLCTMDWKGSQELEKDFLIYRRYLLCLLGLTAWWVAEQGLQKLDCGTSASCSRQRKTDVKTELTKKSASQGNYHYFEIWLSTSHRTQSLQVPSHSLSSLKILYGGLYFAVS